MPPKKAAATDVDMVPASSLRALAEMFCSITGDYKVDMKELGSILGISAAKNV